ncbi:MAG: glucose-phosphate thymidylyltransferase [Solirubrobacteraceae bacterium]|jgi:glucose-1-phosphate thymidylyltransferase|nr:glucose-phosphate thymidylyltransferase [Solirubrobacteraceae bacterium]
MLGPPKALIVTAGLLHGDRVGQLGVRVCPLVPIANRPLLAHVLDGLRSAGVREAAVLGDGATRAEVAAVLGAGSSELAIRYVDHVDARAIDAPAVIVQPADAMLRAAFDTALLEVATARIDGAVMRLAAPAARVGACVLGTEAADALAASLDGSRASVDALADTLVASSERVSVDEVRGCLACGDGNDGLLRANRLALETLVGDVDGASLVDSEIQGPAVIHPTARLRSTLVRGPVVIGAGVKLDDVYVGPYTAIADDVVIEGAEIEHSLVLGGAEVRYPGVRLTTSIIGPRARLVRDFHLPRGMRVAVGADALVALS